jgi:S-methylmethionine-dependent homocysteine/selenocysteine methylase
MEISQAVRSDLHAHSHAMEIPIAQVVQELIDLLGAPTVATIGNVKETRAVQEWLADRKPQKPHVLRFALQLATMIAGGSEKEMATAWFHGCNPHLEDRVPMLMLRDNDLDDVQMPLLTAARAFAAR